VGIACIPAAVYLYTIKFIDMNRKPFLLVAFLLLCGAVNAQNCKNYLLLQNNKKVEMTIYNKKGKEDGKQVWNVSNSKSSGNTTTATINSEFFDKKGKSINKSINEVKCVGGQLMMNMKMMLSEQQMGMMKDGSIKATGEFLEYPANLKDGDQLKDGNLQIDYEMESGMKGSIELSITNRKIEGKESVTSPAGTWECFKITSNQKIVSRIGGIGIPIKMEITEWFAPGVGVIKSESKFGSTLITSIQ
jgi:hypothetical protein